jgi:DNA gyrase subunit A
MAQVIISDLDALKKEFSSKRKTVIENGEEAVYKEKEFEEMDVYFIMDRFGYCKMIDLPTFDRNKEAIAEEIKFCLPVRNNGRIAVFTENGQMHTLKMTDLPMSKFRDKGVPVDNITNFDSSSDMIIYAEDLSTVLLGRYLFVTSAGMCKLTSGTEFDVSSRRTVTATKLNDGDRIVAIRKVRTEENVILKSANGYFIRFSMSEIPEMKKTAAGVKGIRLDGTDKVETAYITDIVSENVIEYGSRTISLNSIKLLGRGAKGTKIKQ